MPSLYLESGDYATYGVPNATPAQVQQASALINAYIGRQEGLCWLPDASGAPCYMAGPVAQGNLALGAAIAPGMNVSVALTGFVAGLELGSVVIADIGVTGATEALVVADIQNSQVTFAAVKYAHAAGAALAQGLVVTEQRTMPQNRPITVLAKTPVAAFLSGAGRYGYQRRGDDFGNNVDTFNLLAVMSQFGGPPAWEVFNAGANSIDPQTGQLWVPAGVMLAYYTEIRVHYVAGWAYAGLPTPVKQACAQLVSALAQYPEMTAGNMQMLAAGQNKMQRFTASLLDDDIKRMLAPYRAQIV